INATRRWHPRRTSRSATGRPTARLWSLPSRWQSTAAMPDSTAPPRAGHSWTETTTAHGPADSASAGPLPVWFIPSTLPFRVRAERTVAMNHSNSRAEQLLSELWEKYCSSSAKAFQVSRRALLRSSAGGVVVSAVGIGGLLELLGNREAIAAG